MLHFTLRRLLVALLVAITVSLISFGLLRLSGDLAAAIAGPEATEAQVEAIRVNFGLDQPLPVQYVEWLWGRCVSTSVTPSISVARSSS
jgi:ABC-type dipeptide/oligopeptide/nickel transport system permease component